jgi:hypothetical protein
MEKIIFIMIFYSANSFAFNQEYNECINVANGVVPEILECIDKENSTIEKSTNEYIMKKFNTEDYSIYKENLIEIENKKNIFFQEKCNIYLLDGSQNGQILNKQCLLDESLNFNKYIENLYDMLEVQ